jgi:hypothetical protein
MALLERIESMKQSGMSDGQIVTALKEEGNSPRLISEALSQSRIKMAISQEQTGGGEFSGMEPSIMAPALDNQEQPAQMPPTPTAPAYAKQYQNPSAQQYQAQYPPQQAVEQQYYPPEAYAQAGYDQTQQQYVQEAYPAQDQQGYYSQVLDVETVRDIAKQEIEEALKKIKEQQSSFEKIKSEMKFEIQNMENRLLRIESVIQEIQSSIIRKMGEYGEAISGISGEVRATQQSFSKILNPLMDKRRMPSDSEEQSDSESQNEMPSSQQKQKQKQQNSRKDNSASFEDYLR